MKCATFLICIAASTLAFWIVSYAESESGMAGWTALRDGSGAVMTTEHESFYYQRKSVRMLPGGIIQVWVRRQIDSSSVAAERLSKENVDILASLSTIESSTSIPESVIDSIAGACRGDYRKKWAAYSYDLDLLQADCAKRRTRAVRLVNCDDKGRVIYSTDDMPDASWTDPIPDTIGEAQMEGLCRIAKQIRTQE